MTFLKVMFFIPNFRYEQPSGYRPAPLDLSEVCLSLEQEEVVSLLAENNHNAWARERIRQGWTYGAQQVSVQEQLGTNDKMHLEMNTFTQTLIIRVKQNCIQIINLSCFLKKNKSFLKSSCKTMNIVIRCLGMCCFLS